MDGLEWNKLLCHMPDPHILQTWEWGQVKSRYGWEPIYKVWGSEEDPYAVALILERSIAFGGIGPRFRIQYVPKGPILNDWSDQGLVNEVLNDLQILAKRRGAIFLKIDPDVPFGEGIPGSDDEISNPLGRKTEDILVSLGWEYSESQIQFRNSILVDLKPSLAEIMAGMKQKTRYNVRLAKRKGVSIRSGTKDDLDLLYQMYAETSLRDGFAIREADYYYNLWNSFLNQGKKTAVNLADPSCEPLIAEVSGEVVAAVVIFRFAGKAYYMHGMSRPIHRRKMPNYLLQWEAIVRAKSSDCMFYDLWGAPDVFNEDDSMWGVYRFKEGFGGKVVRTIGAYDLVLKPIQYHLYSELLPKVLHFLRDRGRYKVEKKYHNNEGLY